MAVSHRFAQESIQSTSGDMDSVRSDERMRSKIHKVSELPELTDRLLAIVPPGCEYVEAVRVNQQESATELIVLVVEGAPVPSDRTLRARYQLTSRESEVASLLSRRMSSREIAEKLFISVNTARRHSERVLQKMGLKRRSQVRKTLLRLYRHESD